MSIFEQVVDGADLYIRTFDGRSVSGPVDRVWKNYQGGIAGFEVDGKYIPMTAVVFVTVNEEPA